ncbi:hypothetical protein JNM87_00285 [Candidatus Saccharibacteria bacterium]|nr:hypothetical protein [Candidatus Saccharibacteria bacterium]
MKQIANNILEGVVVAIILPIIGVMLLALSPLFIVLFFISLYGKLWEFIRHDPKQSLMMEGLISEVWQDADTKEDFIGEFKNLSDKIAEMSKAAQETIKKEGFAIFDEPNHTKEWSDLRLAQELHTDHAEVILSFDFGAYYSEEMRQLFVSTEDGDDQCGAGFPPIFLRVTKPELHIARQFTLRTAEDVWMAIGILRGDVKFTQKEGQLWSYIPEHDLWLVQYKINESDYGRRHEFAGKKAHKYSMDS